MEELVASDVLIISHGLALREKERLASKSWNILVLDEAQAIGARSQTAQAIQAIDAKWRLALTGTPIENHLGDLWSLFRTASPGLLGSWERFRKSYGCLFLQGRSLQESVYSRVALFVYVV